jgi:hypothetical protein
MEYPGYKEFQGLRLEEDFVDITVDLITDLLHLVTQKKWQVDADYILRVARSHFEAEQGKEV